jgi:hypothetical protein|tara:strand:- start:461 stop:679 length:219 start_codon:yes stop_codon:yes gene_type:complete
MIPPTLREILLDEEYKTNKNAIKKQRIWSKKQDDIFYNTGRPIFFKTFEEEYKVKPRHLWFLYENKYKKIEF